MTAEQIKTGKVAVIGDKDSALAFKSVGAEVFATDNVFAARDALKRMDAGGYAVVFITEELAEEMGETLKRFKSKAYPAVIPIPSSKGGTGLGMRGLKSDVEKALGTDIIFNKRD